MFARHEKSRLSSEAGDGPDGRGPKLPPSRHLLPEPEWKARPQSARRTCLQGLHFIDPGKTTQTSSEECRTSGIASAALAKRQSGSGQKGNTAATPPTFRA